MSKKVNQKATQKSNLTTYHAKYFAYELTRLLPSNDINKFTASLQDAKVDLNPHQVEAALFAFASPLSQGALLADEVGLGKTIEAGIILLQQWSENKRKLLIICPANLRKQTAITPNIHTHAPTHTRREELPRRRKSQTRTLRAQLECMFECHCRGL